MEKNNEFWKKVVKALNIFTFAAFFTASAFLYSRKEFTASFWLMMAVTMQLVLNKLESELNV